MTNMQTGPREGSHLDKDGSVSKMLDSDMAGTYRRTYSDAEKVIPADVTDDDLKSIQEQGFIIIENLLSAEEVRDIRAAATPLLDETGRNEFEGTKTQRVYAVLQKTRAMDRIVDHPRILAILDRVFPPNYLLSQLQVINILPGESAQALHRDDGFYPLQRPYPELGMATVWAIDDFTEENGATLTAPGSHEWLTDRVPSSKDDIRPAVMPAGSVVVYPARFWHGGGANISDNARLAVTAQYCAPWLRQQENFFLSVSKDVANTVSEDIRRMLGYSIHPPFIGMVDGKHPKRVLKD